MGMIERGLPCWTSNLQVCKLKLFLSENYCFIRFRRPNLTEEGDGRKSAVNTRSVNCCCGLWQGAEISGRDVD